MLGCEASWWTDCCLACHWLGKNAGIEIFLDAFNVMKMNLCMMVVINVILNFRALHSRSMCDDRDLISTKVIAAPDT